MRWCWRAAIILLAAQLCGAQGEIKRPPLLVPEAAESPSGLVPKGWRLEQSTLSLSDLNGDGQPDAAFVLSNGGSGLADEPAIVKHVLVLALRRSDGKLHTSIVNDAAVLDGDEGGVFGDPFQELSVDHGVVMIQHYGGSRDRWGFTHRYRFQDNQWKLIGLGLGNTDSLNPEHYDNQDIDLLTGLVQAAEAGGNDGEPPKPERSGAYYELQVTPVEKSPKIDGEIGAGEWPGYSIHLNQRQQVLRNRQLWRGASDLSARINAVRVGADLFLSAEVSDDHVVAGDRVNLVNRRGFIIKPRKTVTRPGAKGYVTESLYSLKEIASAVKASDKYAPENLAMMLDPANVYGDAQGFQLPVSVEVVDVDNRPRGVLSTRLAGSPFTGAIRIFREGALVLTSDVTR
ncbi:MAG TPA: hypothetical protein VKD91_22175 [Pyrinomonadaceae bacterium]|nr:hypothetical protein [Pyrinomonadaceae bacterium]